MRTPLRASPTSAAPPPPPPLWLLCCVCSMLFGASTGDVSKPSAPTVVQALKPSGLRISVPDSRGTDVVIINANINLPINERESGQVSGSVLEPRNGYWTLEAKDLTLKPGDVVFYWVYTAVGDRGERRGGHQAIHELFDSECGPSPTTFNGRTACSGQLIFDDNFDTFNRSIWKHSIQFTDDPDIDFATYTDNPKNSFVKDGKLHLKATVLTEDELLTPTKLEKCTWNRGGAQYCERHPMGWNILPPTRSALLTTKGTFSFKFGRLDIRAKMAAGDWLISRLMLEPQAGVYGRNPYESGRVEIAKIRGNADMVEKDGLQAGARMNVVQADIATCSRILYIFKLCNLNIGTLYSSDMHLFSVIWTPQSLKIRIDNDCEHEIKPPDGSFLKHGYFKNNCHNSPWEKGTHLVPFDQEFYIHLCLLPGGFNFYQQESISNGNPKPWTDKDPRAFLNFWRSRDKWLPTWKSDLEVDYIKVWAL